MSVICLASWWLNFPVHARGPHLALPIGPISAHEDSFEKAAEKLERVHKKSLQCIICYVRAQYISSLVAAGYSSASCLELTFLSG